MPNYQRIPDICFSAASIMPDICSPACASLADIHLQHILVVVFFVIAELECGNPSQRTISS
jgi:hypothetical protein